MDENRTQYYKLYFNNWKNVEKLNSKHEFNILESDSKQL